MLKYKQLNKLNKMTIHEPETNLEKTFHGNTSIIDKEIARRKGKKEEQEGDNPEAEKPSIIKQFRTKITGFFTKKQNGKR